MGRPSVLDDRKKAEILRRLALGESPSDLRREYKVSETTFRRNFSAGVSKVREVGTALAQAELALAGLPVMAQVSARTLADHLKGISSDMAEASGIHARNAIKLAQMAQATLGQVDEDAVVLGLESAEEGIKRVMRLTTVSNEAGRMPLGLMAANRGAAAPAPGDAPVSGVLQVPGPVDPEDWDRASRAQQAALKGEG